MINMLSESVQHNLEVIIIVSKPNIISRNRTFDHFLLYLEHFLNQCLLECQNNPKSPLKSKLRTTGRYLVVPAYFTSNNNSCCSPSYGHFLCLSLPWQFDVSTCKADCEPYIYPRLILRRIKVDSSLICYLFYAFWESFSNINCGNSYVSESYLLQKYYYYKSYIGILWRKPVP